MLKSGIRQVWAQLPTEFRRSLAHGLIGLMQPHLDRVSRERVLDRRVPRIVIGLLSSASGLGQSARLAARALIDNGYSVFGIDVGGLFCEVQNSVAHGLPDARRHRGAAHVVVMVNGHLTPYVLSSLGSAFLREKYVTGYWAWELPRAPELWRRGLATVHEVAVPSRFTAESIKALDATLRVTVAPYPVVLEHPPVSPAIAGTQRPDQPFTVVSALSISSGFARKNPLSLIRAFRLAFGNRSDCRLKLHITGTEYFPAAKTAILASISDALNIVPSWHVLDRPSFNGWWDIPDVYASLHRSEGFGLPLAEAMCAGYPVVATGWSGNADFMTAENSLPVRYHLTEVKDPQGKYSASEGKWADAEVEHAAELLGSLARDPAWQRAIGQSAHKALSSTLTADNFCRALIGDQR